MPGKKTLATTHQTSSFKEELKKLKIQYGIPSKKEKTKRKKRKYIIPESSDSEVEIATPKKRGSVITKAPIAEHQQLDWSLDSCSEVSSERGNEISNSPIPPLPAELLSPQAPPQLVSLEQSNNDINCPPLYCNVTDTDKNNILMEFNLIGAESNPEASSINMSENIDYNPFNSLVEACQNIPKPRKEMGKEESKITRYRDKEEIN